MDFQRLRLRQDHDGINWCCSTAAAPHHNLYLFIDSQRIWLGYMEADAEKKTTIIAVIFAIFDVRIAEKLCLHNQLPKTRAEKNEAEASARTSWQTEKK